MDLDLDYIGDLIDGDVEERYDVDVTIYASNTTEAMRFLSLFDLYIRQTGCPCVSPKFSFRDETVEANIRILDLVDEEEVKEVTAFLERLAKDVFVKIRVVVIKFRVVDREEVVHVPG